MTFPGCWIGTHFGRPCLQARFRSGVSWFRWQSVEAVWYGLRAGGIHVKLAETSASRVLGGRHPGFEDAVSLSLGPWSAPFLEECRRGAKYFGECRACLCYVSTLGTILKKSLCHIQLFDGDRDTYWRIPAYPFQPNTSYLPNPPARAGYDTRSIFKRSLTGLTGLNSEFSFS